MTYLSGHEGEPDEAARGKKGRCATYAVYHLGVVVVAAATAGLGLGLGFAALGSKDNRFGSRCGKQLLIDHSGSDNWKNDGEAGGNQT